MSDHRHGDPSDEPGPGDPGSIELGMCFVIMPFGGLFDEYYRDVIAPAVVDAGLSPCRSDEVRSHQRGVPEEIRRLVAQSTVCLGDVTGQSPNVFYELGLAHGLDRTVVLIAQSKDDVPVELNDRRFLWYRPETVTWAGDLRVNVTASLRETLADAAQVRAPARTPSAPKPTAAAVDLSFEEGETMFRDLLVDGISAPTIERLLVDAGLPSSWVRLRLRALQRPGW
jgi:hypothetical protein